VLTLPPSEAVTDNVYLAGTTVELSSLLLQAKAVRQIPKSNNSFFIKNELILQDINYIYNN
jgi:hypothetical protein